MNDFNVNTNFPFNILDDILEKGTECNPIDTAETTIGQRIEKEQLSEPIQNSLNKADHAVLSVNDVLPDTQGNVTITFPAAEVEWGDITGTITNQEDLAPYLTKAGSAVQKVNGNEPDENGNVGVAAFSPVPSSLESYKNGTVVNFCKAFLNTVSPEVGSAFLTGGIAFSDLPASFVNGSNKGNCELMIYVPSGGALILEITTTNNFSKLWYGGPGTWRAIYDRGTETMKPSWQGVMVCPQGPTKLSDDTYPYLPTENYHGVSKYFLESQIDGLLTVLGQACNGTFTKTWNSTTRSWEFTFTPANND